MRKKSSLTVGVLSDTHLPYRLPELPSRVADIFAGVDLILHAGDVDEIDLLQSLKEIAPLYAVRGNVHLGDLSWGGRNLPFVVQLTLAGYRITLTHGHRPGIAGWVFKARDVLRSRLGRAGQNKLNIEISERLSKLYPDADIVIFGHTHKAHVQQIDKTLFFNPGAVASAWREQASVGLLHLGEDGIKTEIIPLQSGERDHRQRWER
ncbi:MAG TPA: metallophosphoesterase family protein [Chloroflexi bacterium]|nr:metallophosphoesterase family protein [Chloroflexota bacterium]